MSETTKRTMQASAPYPWALEELVHSWKYKPGWMAYLSDVPNDETGTGGLRLFIVSDTENSLDPKHRIRVKHEFMVPPATYNRGSWLIWLRDRVRDVEEHESNEFFMIAGQRVFAPHHGNGENPYITWVIGTQEAADKSAGDD